MVSCNIPKFGVRKRINYNRKFQSFGLVNGQNLNSMFGFGSYYAQFILLLFPFFKKSGNSAKIFSGVFKEKIKVKLEISIRTFNKRKTPYYIFGCFIKG